MRTVDLYAVLGVRRTATDAEVKIAYRRLVQEWHPDHNPHRQQAAERFTRELNRAFQVLCDARRRHDYDRADPTAGLASGVRGDGRPWSANGSASGDGRAFGSAQGAGTGAADSAGAPGSRAPGPGGRGEPSRPRLLVAPAHVDLGAVRPDERVTVYLAVGNLGGGTLRGWAEADVPWLHVEPRDFYGNQAHVALRLLWGEASGLEAGRRHGALVRVHAEGCETALVTLVVETVAAVQRARSASERDDRPPSEFSPNPRRPRVRPLTLLPERIEITGIRAGESRSVSVTAFATVPKLFDGTVESRCAWVITDGHLRSLEPGVAKLVFRVEVPDVWDGAVDLETSVRVESRLGVADLPIRVRGGEPSRAGSR